MSPIKVDIRFTLPRYMKCHREWSYVVLSKPCSPLSYGTPRKTYEGRGVRGRCSKRLFAHFDRKPSVNYRITGTLATGSFILSICHTYEHTICNPVLQIVFKGKRILGCGSQAAYQFQSTDETFPGGPSLTKVGVGDSEFQLFWILWRAIMSTYGGMSWDSSL